MTNAESAAGQIGLATQRIAAILFSIGRRVGHLRSRRDNRWEFPRRQTLNRFRISLKGKPLMTDSKERVADMTATQGIIVL